MAGFVCSFCNHTTALTPDTFQTRIESFYHLQTPHILKNGSYVENISREPGTYAIEIKFIRCPNCEKVSIFAYGYSNELNNLKVPIYPNYRSKVLPEYIPAAIRQDYEEACSIRLLSPKASATLSRRCLQGMIRDYWGVVKNRLVDEIEGLKGKLQPDQWETIDCVRRIGNIGAHMEKDIDIIVDIDENEAERLIELIEVLIDDWYVARYKRQQLQDSIKGIDARTQAERKS